MKERGILFSAPMVLALLAGTKTQTRRAVNPQPADWVEVYDHADGDRHFWCEFDADDDMMRHWPSYDTGLKCPYGKPGDRLYVRETFYAYGHWEQQFNNEEQCLEWHFVDQTLATGRPYLFEPPVGWRPSKRREGIMVVDYWKRPAIFMPRAASRIDLEVTGVRVERLQSISEADAVAEGICISPWTKRDMRCQGIYECLMPDGKIHYSDSAYALYCILWAQINGDESLAANPWVWCVSFKRVQP